MKRYILSLLAVAATVACTKDNSETERTGGGTPADSYGVKITATAWDNASRTSYSDSDGGFKVAWKQNEDKIGVWAVCDMDPLHTNTAYKADADGVSTSFSPDDASVFVSWKDETSMHDFYAYYPYSEGTDMISYTAVPFTVPAEQTQSAEDPFEHVAAFDFIYANVCGKTMPDDRSVNFGFKHALSVLELTLGTESGTSALDAIIFRCTDGSEMLAAENAAVDLSTGDIDYASASGSNQIKVVFAEPLSVDETSATKVYMVLTPGHGGKRFKVLAVEDGVETELAEKGIPASGLPAGARAKLSLVIPNADEPGDGAVNLSATATANCYLVNRPATTYKFRADIMGNGATTPNITPKKLAPAAARLYISYAASGNYKGGTATGWSDNSNNEAGMKLIIDYTTVELKDYNGIPYVYFTTPDNFCAGNAIICVTDEEGNIIWSWHIWAVPDYELGQGDITLSANAKCEGVTIMDRNLGALSCGPEDNNIYDAESNARAAAGMVYQYGRKDPFVNISIAKLDYNNCNGYLQQADGTIITVRNNGTVYGVWSKDEIFQIKDLTFDQAIAEAIAHPERRYQNYATSSNSTNWGAAWCMLEADANSSAEYKSLWGNPDQSDSKDAGVKTIYDPCPVGYRVPSRECYGFFTNDGNQLTKAVGATSPYKINFDKTKTPIIFSSDNSTITSFDMTKCYGFYFYTNSILNDNNQTDADRTDATTTYFPACGYITYDGSCKSSSGTNYRMPETTNSVMMQSNYATTGYARFVKFGYDAYLFYQGGINYSASAAPVRCIKGDDSSIDITADLPVSQSDIKSVPNWYDGE